ncbi:ABC transporter ATP-binding protein [Streptantibioticus parmotrematis]|uniref:ABC transporter ATP-binding protein n=1 Tax=Streptantibioticus parmotrematis TaxID=2873249 RepID=UPI003407E2F4
MERESANTRDQTPPSGPAIVVEGLTKRFGGRTAFADVTLSVEYGEVFGFLGPNGAGKSTTVRTLGTLLAPTSGSATVAGLPLHPANSGEIRRRIAVMPESPGLYPRLSVAENLDFFAGLYELDQRRSRIERSLRAVNLLDRADDPCRSLSKGLRQRVGLARALLSDPRILFLDEPTSGLDPLAAHDVHELIDGLRKRGVTIFLTTHRLAEAEALCDRVGILNTTLRTIGRPDDLRERLFAKTLEVSTRAPLTEPDRVFADLPGVDGWRRGDDAGEHATYVLTITDADLAAPAVARAMVTGGADLLTLNPSRHSLQEVYLQLVNEDVEAQAR